MKQIVIPATLDTKGEEVQYLKELIEENGCSATVIDCSLRACGGRNADIQVEELLAGIGVACDDFTQSEKEQAIRIMQRALNSKLTKLLNSEKIDGVISLGGVQGTVIATAAMQKLPVGLPKFMVSTVANGNTTFGPFVGVSDMAIMHSVVDIGGLNYVLRKILQEAAGAVCGMAKSRTDVKCSKKAVGITMAGVTTPCVTHLTGLLKKQGYETLIFHCNGVGAHVMENLVASGDISAVIDISPHDITDGLTGGLMPNYPERLMPVADTDIPLIFVPGGMDFTLYNGTNRIPEEKKSRHYYKHNEIHTHVRADYDEMKAAGTFVANRLADSHHAVVVIPLRGYSQKNCEGQTIYDPAADRGFADAVRLGGLNVREVDAHINDELFAEQIMQVFAEITGQSQVEEVS